MQKISPFMISIAICLMSMASVRGQGFPLQPINSETIYSGTKIEFYPNPVEIGSVFYLLMDSCLVTTIDKIFIYSEEGFLLKKQSIRLEPGIIRYPVDISGLRSGKFIVRIVGDELAKGTLSMQLDLE
jgi:hypothetical protein